MHTVVCSTLFGARAKRKNETACRALVHPPRGVSMSQILKNDAWQCAIMAQDTFFFPLNRRFGEVRRASTDPLLLLHVRTRLHTDKQYVQLTGVCYTVHQATTAERSKTWAMLHNEGTFQKAFSRDTSNRNNVQFLTCLMHTCF